MSSGYSCPCQFQWPLDTQGVKRDPIVCEKGWLDYAVRLLSREAVGKGKGQEAVWSEKCRPQWWKESVGLPWKNPTANPKDTKDVLQRKYSALECHLNERGNFPRELEEEADLWKNGKHKELFLFTSLASFFGKTRSLHFAVEDIKSKVKDVNARVNTEMLDGIRKCLKSTLKEIEDLYSLNDSDQVPLKRKGCETLSDCELKENISFAPTVPKKRKISTTCQQREAKPSKHDNIIAFAKKMTEKRKGSQSTFQNIKPKTDIACSQSPSVTIITVSPEKFNCLLNSSVSSQPDTNHERLGNHLNFSSNSSIVESQDSTSNPDSNSSPADSQYPKGDPVLSNLEFPLSVGPNIPFSDVDKFLEECEIPNEDLSRKNYVTASAAVTSIADIDISGLSSGEISTQNNNLCESNDFPSNASCRSSPFENPSSQESSCSSGFSSDFDFSYHVDNTNHERLVSSEVSKREDKLSLTIGSTTDINISERNTRSTDVGYFSDDGYLADSDLTFGNGSFNLDDFLFGED